MMSIEWENKIKVQTNFHTLHLSVESNGPPFLSTRPFCPFAFAAEGAGMKGKKGVSGCTKICAE